MATAKKSENKDVLLSQSFEKLELVIENLEKDDISLEEAFEFYKDGVELLKQCKEKIDKVEKKVLILNEAGELDEF